MIRALRQLAGMAPGIAGVALPAWGVFHLVRQPSCGSDGPTTIGPPCPDEMVWWILALVGSAVVLLPLAILIAGKGPAGRSLLLGPIALVAPIALAAGAVVSLVGASADPDTQWVGWLIAGFVGLYVLLGRRGFVRIARGQPRRLQPAGVPSTTVAADPRAADQMAELAGRLQQVAEAKAATARDDLAGRLERLDDLRASGLISPEEHARRRAEILSEL